MALSVGFLSICRIQSMPIKIWYFVKPLLALKVFLTGCVIGSLHYSTKYYNKKKALQILQVKQKLFNKIFSYYNYSWPLYGSI